MSSRILLIDWNNGKVIRTASNDFQRKNYESNEIQTSDESLLLNKNIGEIFIVCVESFHKTIIKTRFTTIQLKSIL
jgi:hypothetical protein